MTAACRQNQYSGWPGGIGCRPPIRAVCGAPFFAKILFLTMVAAILISFGCYLPVTLFSKTKPKVGLLMIPKTCAYMWIIAMGLQLLGSWNG